MAKQSAPTWKDLTPKSSRLSPIEHHERTRRTLAREIAAAKKSTITHPQRPYQGPSNTPFADLVAKLERNPSVHSSRGGK